MEQRLSQGAGEVGTRPYLPAIDGLRFVAFLLVFFHHLPNPAGSVFAFLNERGWIGVEIFLVISSFLLFRNLIEEQEETGKISIGRFYARRLLRVYPLMVLFPLAMIVAFGWRDGFLARLLGIVFFSDNFLIWLSGYDPIAYSAHLWTLSYEFQIYFLIPLAFVLYRSAGRAQFLVALACLLAVALGARLAFILSGVQHPLIWVTPFLRPESTLLGFALAVGLFASADRFGALLTLALALIAFSLLPSIDQVDGWTLVLYPVAAVVAGSTLWLALNTSLSRFLGARWIVFLGRISFGLYVYHLLAIGFVSALLPSLPGNYGTRFLFALALTIALATVSYFVLERPFLTLKKRFEAVPTVP